MPAVKSTLLKKWDRPVGGYRIKGSEYLKYKYYCLIAYVCNFKYSGLLILSDDSPVVSVLFRETLPVSWLPFNRHPASWLPVPRYCDVSWM